MYKEYLAEFWYSAKALENSKVSFSVPTGGIYGEVGVNTFRNAIGAHYLPHSSEYVAPPSIDIVRPWFETIRYGETIPVKRTLKKTKPVVFKAPKPSSNAERVPQGTKPRAKSGHKKHLTSSKQPSVSSKVATKGGSSKAPTISKTSHSKKRKESSSAMDSNPSQPPVSIPVDTGMHKEDQQATGGPTYLGVTSEERDNPQLSSGCDASADSTAEVDPGLSAPNDSIPQQHDQTQSVSEELETIFTQPTIGKGASYNSRQVEKEESSRTIKLEDLAKLVPNVQTSFKDLDSPEDDPVIVADDSDEDKEDEVHTTTNAKTEDTSSPNHKLELEKNKAEAKAALLKAQPSFPNVGQLNELVLKSLETKFSKILSAYNFSSSLLTELKDLPSKFNELTEEVKGLKKQVHELEIMLPGDLKEIPTKLKDFTKTVTSLTSQVAELKTLHHLLNITKDLNKFAQVLDSASSKAEDQSVPSVGQANTMPAEGEKNINQATISQIKKLKKFDFITEDERHIHPTKEEINQQKKLEEDAKAEATKQKGEVRKA
ncbi:hypothetical protein Tco_1065349 [Tanacetum coccineum]